MKFGKIGVLLGGPSSEREISIRSGKAIANALRKRGHDVVEIGETGSIEEGVVKSNIDIAFIALHGRYGEDGTVQKFLEDNNIPYTGSGPLASKLAIDKELAKIEFLRRGINTPEYISINASDNYSSRLKEIKIKLSMPVVVKPVEEGSSIGLSIVKEEKDLASAIELAFSYSKKVIIEKYIDGKELTVGVLGNGALAVVEIVPKKGYYNFEAKYTSGMTEYVVPAKIDSEQYKHVQMLGLLAHSALGCRDMSRVDIRLDSNCKPWVLEVNTIPGFTETSLLPKAAKAVGIGFEDLCEKILELAVSRAGKVKVLR
jgi:D-alanine-D-alanine ligase